MACHTVYSLEPSDITLLYLHKQSQQSAVQPSSPDIRVICSAVNLTPSRMGLPPITLLTPALLRLGYREARDTTSLVMNLAGPIIRSSSDRESS